MIDDALQRALGDFGVIGNGNSDASHMSTDSKSIEGIYRDGKIELLETPTNVDEARVIVTFVSDGSIDLSNRGIDEIAAAKPSGSPTNLR